MFFKKTLSHTILLKPEDFGRDISGRLKDRLYEEVEGTCSGRFGYIITVLEIITINPGKILPNIGSAEYKIEYDAIVFKPFKGEVLDAVVSTVNKMGFFADVGPLQVFVSSHLVPNDMRYDPNAESPSYVSDDDQNIKKDTQVRVKLVGTRIDATEIFAIGTIKEDYLGVIST